MRDQKEGTEGTHLYTKRLHNHITNHTTILRIITSNQTINGRSSSILHSTLNSRPLTAIHLAHTITHTRTNPRHTSNTSRLPFFLSFFLRRLFSIPRVRNVQPRRTPASCLVDIAQSAKSRLYSTAISPGPASYLLLVCLVSLGAKKKFRLIYTHHQDIPSAHAGFNCAFTAFRRAFCAFCFCFSLFVSSNVLRRLFSV